MHTRYCHADANADADANKQYVPLPFGGGHKLEYEHMFNDKKDEVFDQEHLKNIVSSIQNPDSNIFSKSDCTSLKSPIAVEEVKHSVYNAKLRKATGCDDIPVDIPV